MANAVRHRIDEALLEVTPLQLTMVVGMLLAVGATMLFADGSVVHAAAHNFRHGAGITCH